MNYSVIYIDLRVKFSINEYACSESVSTVRRSHLLCASYIYDLSCVGEIIKRLDTWQALSL